MDSTSSQPAITPVWQGFMPYLESLTLQGKLKQQAKTMQKSFFVGFECPACITLGLRGSDKDIYLSREECRHRGIQIVSIKRGGQATLHAPGQLVIYPVLNLLYWKIRPRDFLSLLENITIKTLKEHGVLTHKQEKLAGLFTSTGKIVFFGIHISEGVSQHGLSINVKNDLNLFRAIRSCGVENRPHDSVLQQGVKTTLKDLFFLWCEQAVLELNSHGPDNRKVMLKS